METGAQKFQGLEKIHLALPPCLQSLGCFTPELHALGHSGEILFSLLTHTLVQKKLCQHFLSSFWASYFRSGLLVSCFELCHCNVWETLKHVFGVLVDLHWHAQKLSEV